MASQPEGRLDSFTVILDRLFLPSNWSKLPQLRQSRRSIKRSNAAHVMTIKIKFPPLLSPRRKDRLADRRIEKCVSGIMTAQSVQSVC